MKKLPHPLMRFFSVIIILLTIISCEQIIDSYIKEKARERYTSPFMGTWFGKYTGDESGSFSITVAKSGFISGNYGPDNDKIFSSVGSLGVLAVMVSNDPMFFHLRGSLETKKGSWIKGNLKGDWTITKQ